MFLTELVPLLRDGLTQPVAFMGGLFAGLFRLDLAQDPVKTWLDQQIGATAPSYTTGSDYSSASQNGTQKGPKSIQID